MSENQLFGLADKELLLNTAVLLQDMANAMQETAETDGSFDAICHKKNLDPTEIQKLIRQNFLQRCRVENPNHPDENESSDSLNKAQKEYLNMPITELEFRPRALRTLKDHGVTTIGQLLNLTQKEIMEFHGRGAGRKTIDEILAGIDAATGRLQSMAGMTDESIRKAKLESDIRILNLSVRSHNALKRGGVQSIGTLLTMDYTQLLYIRNIGKSGIAEIQDAITERIGEIRLTEQEKQDYALVRTLPMAGSAIRSLNYNGIWIVKDLLEKTTDDLKRFSYLYETDKEDIGKMYEKLQSEK